MAQQTIKLGGKNRPIRYSHKALRMLAAEFNAKSFQDLGQRVMDMGIEDVPFLTWVGLKEGARHLKEPFEDNIETVGLWLDDEPASVFQTVMEVFSADFSGQEEKKETAKVEK